MNRSFRYGQIRITHETNANDVILLLGSNFVQLLLMPLILVGQNVQSRHLEIQAEVDHKTLGYIRAINDTQLQILRRLQATEDWPAPPDAAAANGDLSPAVTSATGGDTSDLQERGH